MTPSVLVDAGPLVAVVHRDDVDHQPCVEALQRLREPLLTTWMPVTEAMYLPEFSPPAQSALLEMIERRAPQVLEVGAEDMPEVRLLLNKYRNVPMDFADGTLVHATNREKIQTIFTLDKRDFSVYRLARGRAFTIIPD